MDFSKGIDKTSAVIAILVGLTQIFGFIFSDENTLKGLIVFLFIVNLLFAFMLSKQKKDMHKKTIEYKKDLSKLDLELYDKGMQLEISMKRDMEKNPESAKEILEEGMTEYVSKLSERR